MSKQFNWILGALLALTLAACGGETDKEQSEAGNATNHGEHDEDNHDQDDHTNSEYQETRFIASSATGIHVFNENFEEVKSFHFSNASISQIAKSPYIFVKDSEQNSAYQFLHAGVWTDDHGDHSHSYAEDAVMFEQQMKGNKPAHIVSFSNQIAVFNDGDGSVQVYKVEDISNGSAPTLLYEYKGIAHHGVAIPLENEMLAVSYPAKEGDALPTGVKIVNAAGEEKAIVTATCEQLHGAAYSGNTLAFGCVGKTVLYDTKTKETKEIPLKDAGSRVGTFKFSAESNYLLTNYSIGKNASTEVGIINRQTSEMSYVALPAAYKSALLATEYKGYVLAEDGNIYEIDYATSTISAVVEAINPFDLNEQTPSLLDVNRQIYIMIPNHEFVYAIHGDHAHVVELPFAPTSFIVK